MLKKDLNILSFQNIQNLISMRTNLTEICCGFLTHLTVMLVEFEQQSINLWRQLISLQSNLSRFIQKYGVTMRR